MKKKFLLGIPCAAIAIASVIGVSQFDSENLAGNDLMMENVEALASGEGGIFIPCYSVKDRTCTFNIKDAAGQFGTATVRDAEKAAPYA